MVEPKDHQGVVPFSRNGMFGIILNRPQGYLCKTTFAVTDFLDGHLTACKAPALSVCLHMVTFDAMLGVGLNNDGLQAQCVAPGEKFGLVESSRCSREMWSA